MTRLKDLLVGLPHLDVTLSPLEFTSFPQLPLELRNRIWKYAAFEPRTIRLFKSGKENPPSASYFEGQSSVPSILHTCRESRKEGLLNYQAIEEKRDGRWPTKKHDNTKFEKPGSLFINFAVDRFISGQQVGLPYETRSYNMGEDDMRKIQHLDFYFNNFSDNPVYRQRHLLSQMKLLEDSRLIYSPISVETMMESVHGHLIIQEQGRWMIDNGFNRPPFTDFKPSNKILRVDIEIAGEDLSDLAPCNDGREIDINDFDESKPLILRSASQLYSRLALAMPHFFGSMT